MKKILEITSWTILIIGIIFCCVGAISLIGGAVTFVMALFNASFAYIFSYCTIVFFVSIDVLFILYLIFCVYLLIEKAVKR